MGAIARAETPGHLRFDPERGNSLSLRANRPCRRSRWTHRRGTSGPPAAVSAASGSLAYTARLLPWGVIAHVQALVRSNSAPAVLISSAQDAALTLDALADVDGVAAATEALAVTAKPMAASEAPEAPTARTTSPVPARAGAVVGAPRHPRSPGAIASPSSVRRRALENGRSMDTELTAVGCACTGVRRRWWRRRGAMVSALRAPATRTRRRRSRPCETGAAASVQLGRACYRAPRPVALARRLLVQEGRHNRCGRARTPPVRAYAGHAAAWQLPRG